MRILVQVLFGGVCATALLSAAAISFNPNDVTVNFVDVNNRVVGWEFTPNIAIDVTRLGFYDADQDGLFESHPVGIYSLGGTLLGSATVPAGSSASLSGVFRFVDLASAIHLNAGTTYVISALLPGNGDGWVWWPSLAGVNVTNPLIDPAITLGGFGAARFDCCSVSSLQFPSQTIGSAFPGDQRVAFVGPNFEFVASPVPEPSYLAVSTVALGALVFFKRRRTTA